MQTTNSPLGRLQWAIPEGYIPMSSHGPEPELTSHETACILNTCDTDARVVLTIGSIPARPRTRS